MDFPRKLRIGQAVIVDVTESSHADMDKRNPSLRPMMSGAMQPIARADGGCNSRRFNAREQRLVVDNLIVEQNLIMASLAKMLG